MGQLLAGNRFKRKSGKLAQLLNDHSRASTRWASLCAAMAYSDGGRSGEVTCSNRPVVGLSAARSLGSPSWLDYHPSPLSNDPERFCGSIVLGANAVGKRLYVGNLSFKVTSQDLEALF